jgi:triacylglycerol lipase
MRHGVVHRRLIPPFKPRLNCRTWMKSPCYHRNLSSKSKVGEHTSDPRAEDLDRLIEDDFATLREKYQTPKYPIVLAHGLLGFDELRLAGKFLPGVQYWRGIKEAMNANNIEVITTAVPASASIEQRATALLKDIKAKARGKTVNIVAHSMGGLDARYLISNLKPWDLEIKSLTTIATPHRGSSFADFLLREIGEENVPRVYKLMERLNLDSGAFSQLTTKYMRESFNPANPDDPSVRYFSYGAQFRPSFWSMFNFSHNMIDVIEGPNDGLVSVTSSKWDEQGYRGTLDGVSHLDLINWCVFPSNCTVQRFSYMTIQDEPSEMACRRTDHNEEKVTYYTPWKLSLS